MLEKKGEDEIKGKSRGAGIGKEKDNFILQKEKRGWDTILN